MTKSFFAVAIVLLWMGRCEANAADMPQPFEAFTQATGFGITPIDGTATTPITSYTDPTASNWNVMQWGNSETLGALSAVSESTWEASSTTTHIHLAHTGLNHAAQALAQFGDQLPCETSAGQPNEFDLLLQPNQKSFNPDQPSAYLPDNTPSMKSQYYLSNMSSLTGEGNVEIVKTWWPKTSRTCAVNQGGALVGLVFSNPTSQQVLFYKVALNYVCASGIDQQSCDNKYQTNFYWPGLVTTNANGKSTTQFGVDDPLKSYGIPEIDDNGTHSINLDFLSRLQQNIFPMGAQYGLDQDQSHWFLSGFYYGQHVWGDVGLRVRWDEGYKLMITPSAPTT